MAQLRREVATKTEQYSSSARRSTTGCHGKKPFSGTSMILLGGNPKRASQQRTIRFTARHRSAVHFAPAQSFSCRGTQDRAKAEDRHCRFCPSSLWATRRQDQQPHLSSARTVTSTGQLR